MQEQHPVDEHVKWGKRSGGKDVTGFDSAKPFLRKNPKVIIEDTGNNLTVKSVYHITF